MKIINILTSGMSTANSCAFVIPLIKNKENLKEHGIKINFHKYINHKLFDCNFLVLDSKSFKYEWDKIKIDKTKKLLHEYKKKVNNLVFLDLSDSCSFIINEALEVCDIYLKNQTYKEYLNYLKPFYGRRIFTDFYHKKFNIEDSKVEFGSFVKNKNNLKKIKVSWNSCFCNYSFYGDIMTKLYKYFPYVGFLKYPKHKVDFKKKIYSYNNRMNFNYSKETIAYQRKKISKILECNNSNKKVSKWSYHKELIKSKILISPFGYGEINLKDFEAFLYGCLLFKPNMNHLKTWPNFYQNGKTYIDFNWNLKDFKKKLEDIIENYDSYLEIARNANNFYHYYLHNKKSNDEFCLRVKTIFTD
tara:strand:+ start:19 stop:1095 length:1077 start_codon:yes stop_codon:yes gene_type:complete